MEITYELTQADFVDSFIAHRKRTALAKWWFRLIACCAFVLAALAVLPLLLRTSHYTILSLVQALGLTAFWGILVWGYPWWFARQQYSKQPKAHGTRELIADAEGVHLSWNGGSAKMEWNNLVRYLESKDQFLLYTSPACFNIVPKRALTPGQISEFRLLLVEHISQRSGHAAVIHN